MTGPRCVRAHISSAHCRATFDGVLGLTATPRAAAMSHSPRFPGLCRGPSVSSLIRQGVLVPPIVHGPKQPLSTAKGGSSKDG